MTFESSLIETDTKYGECFLQMFQSLAKILIDLTERYSVWIVKFRRIYATEIKFSIFPNETESRRAKLSGVEFKRMNKPNGTKEN